jgi:uncharacterized short protein YbdD (DUF466 family)
MAKLQGLFQGIWNYLGELLGDKEYSRYHDHILARGGEPMTPQEFYLWRVQHKYSSPAGCC